MCERAAVIVSYTIVEGFAGKFKFQLDRFAFYKESDTNV
jgi:hypothetical protein